VWTHRNDVTPDSISYIEIGWATARGGLHQVVNAYWSPLYPFLLSLVFRLFHPTAQWEFTAAHLLNFAVYVLSLASFEVFLKELTLGRRGWRRIIGGYLSGFCASRVGMGISLLSVVQFLLAGPRVGNAGSLPQCGGFSCDGAATAHPTRPRKLVRVRLSWGAAWPRVSGESGDVPVVIRFPIQRFCLCRIAGASVRAAAIRTLLAGGVFAGFALPLVLALSVAKGRPTFGDSGRINYIEFVNQAPRSVHWQGSPAGTGTPLHPTRKIFSNPDVYEFTHPVRGSYPPWYDPSHWYEGARPHLC